MAAVTGLTVVKNFIYRGVAGEEWGNTYHFKGSPPGDDASWGVLLSDVVNKEKLVLSTQTTYVRAYGYNSDDPNAHHVYAWTWDPATAPKGTFTPTAAAHKLAGDQAICVEWLLNRLSSRGKPVYLRKYFHGGYESEGDGDAVQSDLLTAMNAFANLGSGINSVHGGLRSRRLDDSVTSGRCLPWVTTRTLKRRGKRPRTGS